MDMDAASPAEAVEPVVADSIWQLARLRAELTPDRVLIADVILSNQQTYPATPAEPFRGIIGGFYKPHLSAHLNAGVPRGANVAYKDGHARWKKFNSPPAGFPAPSGMWSKAEDAYTMVRTTSGPWFWW